MTENVKIVQETLLLCILKKIYNVCITVLEIGWILKRIKI